MQNTRLNTIVGTTINQTVQLFRNPWRRVSLLLISFLFGFFLGSAIATSAGQRAQLDIVAAFLMLLLTEFISRLTYGASAQVRRSVWIESANALKLGIIYSLFLDAFKLGS